MNPPSTAPRDMTPFLGDFGWPWLLMTMWNGIDEKWVVATVQCGPVDGCFEDTYFECDGERQQDLLGWMPLPKPPSKQIKNYQPTCPECRKSILSKDGTMDDTHARCYPTKL